MRTRYRQSCARADGANAARATSLVLGTFSPSLIHASFGDFLLDGARATHYHIDFEEWIHTMFRCAFPRACRLLAPHNGALWYLKGQSQCYDDLQVGKNLRTGSLSNFLQSSFRISSRKDQLIGIVREILVENLLSSWFSELDRWSDETKSWQGLAVLVAILHPETRNQVSFTFFRLAPAEAVVPQYETFSPENQGFLMQLRTRCDSVLHTYLSKIADTAEKRNYLCVLNTACDATDNVNLAPFLDDITQILDLLPPTFQPCRNPQVLYDAWGCGVVLYLRDFLSDSERSKLFYCDPGLWSAAFAARHMRYMRTTRKLR